MNIYVDEAGSFVVPGNKANSISCVGALIIPESLEADIFASFQQIKIDLGFGTEEIKGRCLNESQIAEIISFLRRYDIIFEVAAIDMALHTDNDITRHKSLQAARVTENIPAGLNPKFIDELRQLQQQYQILSNQLYVQSACMLELFYSVLNKSTLYYVQRIPSELGNFNWFIDAKDKELTPYENLLRHVIGPALQDISRKSKFIELKGADYSFFQKFMKTSPTPPKHLSKAFGDVSPFKFVDITDIFQKNLSFIQSDENMGIQLVDILTTSIRRAMNNTLQIDGWGNIGALMVQSANPKKPIQMLHLFPREKSRVPYFRVLEITNRMCKQMLRYGD